MTAPGYGRVFAQWRQGCLEQWSAFTHHAFVEGLRDGSLSQSAFTHYLIQDYVFLVHFSRAWSLGVIKAETLDEMKTCAATVDTLINHEMDLHIRTCAAAGINETTLFSAPENIENLAYTRYVMDAGLQGDFLDLMAALAPCVFGYGEIGLRLGRTRVKDTPYADWISTYAGDDYQSAMTRVGAMIDDAVTLRLGREFQNAPRWVQLQKRFTRATELEAGFWEMGLKGR